MLLQRKTVLGLVLYAYTLLIKNNGITNGQDTAFPVAQYVITNQTILVKPVHCIPCPPAGSLSTVTLQKLWWVLSHIKGTASEIGGSLTPLVPGGWLTTSEEEERVFFLFLLEELSGTENEQFHFVLSITNLMEEENFLCYSPQWVMASKSLHMQELLYSVF